MISGIEVKLGDSLTDINVVRLDNIEEKLSTRSRVPNSSNYIKYIYNIASKMFKYIIKVTIRLTGSIPNSIDTDSSSMGSRKTSNVFIVKLFILVSVSKSSILQYDNRAG